jgi:hypothetical protein
VPVGLAEPVARPELHRLVARRRLGRAEPVVLQVAVAVLVEQEAAFAAACLGEQKAGARHARGVVLHELHVAQRHAVAVGERHAIAGDDAAVGVLAERAACAAGGDDHRLGLHEPEFAGRDVDRHHTLHTALVDDQVHAEVLVQAPDRRVLHRRLEQRVQHVEAGLVGGEPCALDLHAAEGAHVHAAVGRAAPWAAPVLHLHHLLVRLRDEVLDDVLLAEPVAAGHRVVEVRLKAVVGLCHRRRAALGGHGVAAHRVDLGDERDGQCRVVLGRRDGRAQAAAARPDDCDVDLDDVHGVSRP